MSDYVGIFITAAVLASAAFRESMESGAQFPNGTAKPQPKDINAALWETFRVFYAALIGASGDIADWPSPSRVMPPTGKASSPSAN